MEPDQIRLTENRKIEIRKTEQKKFFFKEIAVTEEKRKKLIVKKE